MGQFQQFVIAIDTLERRQMVQDLTITATASQGDEKAIKKLQRQLDPSPQQAQIPDKYIGE